LFKLIAELEPNFAKAYIGLGNTLDDQGKSTEAIAQYKKAISLDPKNAYAYYNLAVTLGRQQQLEDAIVALKKARELFQIQRNSKMLERVDRLFQKINTRQIN
jgi:superkiller protein 3